jgi:hypothetical protein
MPGTLSQPRQGKTVAEIARQELVKRFNTGRIPLAGEIAKAAGTAELDIDGFVQKAAIRQIKCFAEGTDPSDYTVELFEKAAPHADNRYRNYVNANINVIELDNPTTPIIIEDLEPVKVGVTVPTKKQLHVKITNNSAGNTMHITDIEIHFNELIP